MVKASVLQILEKNKGKFISGSEMAKAVGVSRNAVWKAICSLKSDGYKVLSIKNKGYALEQNCDCLSAGGIKAFMQSKGEIFVFDEVTSTNDICKKMATDGAIHGTVVVAKKQTQGRGRRGREFFSPSDTGIYMSVLLRLNILPTQSALVTTASAVGVCDAIESVAGKEVEIKWINDVYFNGKKCAGILTEGIFNLDDASEFAVIVGIGINTTTTDFPKEIKNVATSLGEVSRNELIAKIVDNLLELTQNLQNKAHFKRYNEKCFTIGKKIKVLKGDDFYYANALSVDDDGRLVVKNESGEIINLYNEEVSTTVE